MAMRILNKLSPKRLFPARKSRSVSKSEPASFSSSSSSSSVPDTSKSAASAGASTPTSVLPPQASGECPDASVGFEYELLQAFRLMDRDGDGKISRRDLSEMLSRVGADPPSEGEVMTMLREVDRDGDGCISLEEFGSIGHAFGPACGSELREVFSFFDKDSDGRITAEELLMVFQAIGDEGCTLDDCRRMIDGVNRTGDGFVCFEDFTRMME